MDQLNPEVHGSVEDITDLENHRIWIGYDKQMFEDVQKEAFRLGYGWFGPIDDKGDAMYVHQHLSTHDAEDVAWVAFVDMQTPNGKFKVMGINTRFAAGEFKLDARGLNLNLDHMKAIQVRDDN